jgi:hypothetical protein
MKTGKNDIDESAGLRVLWVFSLQILAVAMLQL